ncbi:MULTISPECIES: recombinase-like helix-turn-helix domain-containing protein [unclassified Rhodococcus (in: high G+C Gram-positive bacteria)]|uniref:recombinase-like helix-turn-helix domain-containing protein n=1 Tax=Rhodococcus sp. SJ-3 TaxID=3454628 RepID=UPI003F7A8E4F
MTRYLEIHQARSADLTPYEIKLAKAIEQVFGTGVHDLEGLVEGLNGSGIHGPDGQPWTPISFTTEMQRIGA